MLVNIVRDTLREKAEVQVDVGGGGEVGGLECLMEDS